MYIAKGKNEDNALPSLLFLTVQSLFIIRLCTNNSNNQAREGTQQHQHKAQQV
jgi:hypothetical protein